MATELVACPACGTKNASHRKVCLRCGANILAPAETKATKQLSFLEMRNRWIVLTLEKRSVSSEASEVYKYIVAAGQILSAGPGLFDGIKDHLGDREMKSEWLLLFNAEVTCYILHMLDRVLAMLAFASSRANVMDSLVVTLSDVFSFVLKEMGYTQFDEEELAKEIDGKTFMDRIDKQIKQVALRTGQQMPPKKEEQLPGFLALVVNGFREMCNERQVEYGALKNESWFGDVGLRFGKHAGQALEAEEGTVVFYCAVLAPDIFHVLLSDLVKLADIDT